MVLSLRDWDRAREITRHSSLDAFSSCECLRLKFVAEVSRMTSTFEEEQRQLGQLWKKARKDGCMSPWQQARVCDLSEAWDEIHGGKTYGKAKWISERVHVHGLGRKHRPPRRSANSSRRRRRTLIGFRARSMAAWAAARPSCQKPTNQSWQTVLWP